VLDCDRYADLFSLPDTPACLSAMTIRLLRTLVAVADHKTFTAAAEVVHVTHAAVSQQMRTLEAELGVALFDRSKRTPGLTPIAREVVEKARVLISDYDGLVPSLLADGGMSGLLKVGALGTTLTGLTPRALTELKRQHPQVRLHIRPGLTNDLLAELERGNLDAAIVSKPHLMPAGIAFRALAEERMHLIASRNEAETDPIRLLRTRPFIRFNRNAVVGSLIENWLSARQIPITESMELDSAEAIASMVHADLGVSIVPRLTVQPGAFVPVQELDLGPDAPARCLGLACREDQVKRQAIDALQAAFDAVVAVAGAKASGT
jgi:DNA-binding transcriptional LysR family regulator